ncbi:Dihydroorotase [Gracilariopsis chorda]|uniref:dihydroorotase n=1 Tax=Gracilariopsis chorda TaxID=448386 RepID=A0A2V3IXH4_9FLOR|nr:Dihydroorotase [Gracilariopsis chorda]|eukprot:PXF46842.1 Dihydroorotase [Gracilariopsis chorda]
MLVCDTDTPTILTIRRPDDFHTHFRDDEMLKVVAPYTARQFSRAIVMPNLRPPVRNADDAIAYRKRIMSALPNYPGFEPLMTLYLTDDTTSEMIHEAHASGLVKACKLYPAGATTNSSNGVTSVEKITEALHAMQEVGMVLCVHGESTEDGIEIFDREERFVRQTLPILLQRFPTLKIVLEHVTTAEAVEVVKSTPGNRLAATITAHHLLYSVSSIFEGGKIRPAMFCLPILKRETHRQALLRAIAEDTDGKFFAGTDSAPHRQSAKFCPAGCAGIFSAHAAIELYAEAFEQAAVLHKLEAFVSESGARFYGLPLNKRSIKLVKSRQAVPSKISVPGSDPIVPLRAGEYVQWMVTEAP